VKGRDLGFGNPPDSSSKLGGRTHVSRVNHGKDVSKVAGLGERMQCGAKAEDNNTHENRSKEAHATFAESLCEANPSELGDTN
jgi:hypothetical protein